MEKYGGVFMLGGKTLDHLGEIENMLAEFWRRYKYVDDAYATALLWRGQRLGLKDPMHRKLLRPYLPKGPKEGRFQEMYSLWRAAGLFEDLRAQAAKSQSADLAKDSDYDKLLAYWMTRLRYQIQPWPAEAKTAMNFAIESYGFEMADPEIFKKLEDCEELDEELQREMDELKGSVLEAEEERKRFPVEKLNDFDSLFIGHSNFHVENPFQPWEDTSLAIRKRFKEKCQRPLYNDVGFYHSEDLLLDLLEDQGDAEGLPLALQGQSPKFDLIAGVTLVLDEPMLERMWKLLKPGGVIIWNTWWRHEGEYPGLRPNLQSLGYEAMKDEELPLSFVTSPFTQSGASRSQPNAWPWQLQVPLLLHSEAGGEICSTSDG
ncbi:unnamed protein product [Durusdinium trenchii]|uniref:Uncharacterized protein n=1 Tax=Durusdinium trenchii TaxID=1381693 RepID=A0ABP0I2H2_9DINO